MVSRRSTTFAVPAAGRYGEAGWRSCHCAQSLSMKAWCIQKTGSLGETPVPIWPPTQTCTRLCRLTPRQPSRWLRKPPVDWLFQGASSYVVMARTLSTSALVGSWGTPAPSARRR